LEAPTNDKKPVQLVGFNPDHSAFNLPEVNQQLDKLKLPDTVLFDRSSRGSTQKQTQIAQNKTITTEAGVGHDYTGWSIHRVASFSADGTLITVTELLIDSQAGSR